MDKLTIINRALGATGNNTLNMLADPDYDDEWIVTNQAFERRIDDLSSRAHWPFGTKRAALVLASTDLTLDYPYGFTLPTDCLHLRAIIYGNTPQSAGWRLEGNTVYAAVSSGLTALYNFEQAEAKWHPQAAEILTLFLEADCFRGLNEDFVAADNRDRYAEGRLGETRSLVSQENPARNTYRSSIRTARRTRKA